MDLELSMMAASSSWVATLPKNSEKISSASRLLAWTLSSEWQASRYLCIYSTQGSTRIQQLPLRKDHRLTSSPRCLLWSQSPRRTFRTRSVWFETSSSPNCMPMTMSRYSKTKNYQPSKDLRDPVLALLERSRVQGSVPSRSSLETPKRRRNLTTARRWILPQVQNLASTAARKNPIL